MGYKYKINANDFLPEKLNPGRSYILGVAWADGYLCNRQGLRITSADRDWLCSFPMIGGFTAPIYQRKSAKAFDVVINCRTLIPIIADYGFHASKSKTGTPRNVPRELLSHFMRGVFDGDGSVWTQKAQIRVFIAGNQDSVSWYRDVLPISDGFFISQRSSQNSTINGRLIKNNGHCKVLQSGNSESAGMFLEWIYKDKESAFLPRKYEKYRKYLDFKKIYSLMECLMCGVYFDRRSSTDRYCSQCARVRMRICNRRSDHRRRNPASASDNLNDYRTLSEMHIEF